MDKKTNGKVPIEDAILKYIQNREFVKVKELNQYFQMGDERNVRRIVEKLREQGEPICRSNQGYYYSTDPTEIQRTISQLLSQAQGHIRTAKNLKLIKEKIEATA